MSTSTGLIWQGFDYRWLKHPHRLSYLGTWFDYEPRGNELSGDHRFEVKIGAWPGDRADYRVGYGNFESSSVFVGYGAQAKIRLAARLGEVGGVNDPVSVTVRLADLQSTWTGARSGFDRAAVVLNGFHLAVEKGLKDEHGEAWTSGWHLGRLGFWIPPDSVQIRGDRVTFEVERRFGPSHSPDPFTHAGPGGLGQWPEAAVCAYHLTLHYAVVAGPSADFDFEADELELSARRGTTSYTHFEETLWKGPPGFAGAMPALTGFEVSLRDARRNGDRRDARYIRELRMGLGPARWEAERGTLRARTHFEFSNDADTPGTAKDWSLKGSVKTMGLFFRSGSLPGWRRLQGSVENSGQRSLGTPLSEVQAVEVGSGNLA